MRYGWYMRSRLGPSVPPGPQVSRFRGRSCAWSRGEPQLRPRVVRARGPADHAVDRVERRPGTHGSFAIFSLYARRNSERSRKAATATAVAWGNEWFLRREVEGLRIALSALEEGEGRVQSRPGFVERMADVLTVAGEIGEWRRLPRTEAIERIFAEVGTPLHRTDLHERLMLKGRIDSLGALSAALSYLKREGRAQSLGRGRWLVGSQPIPSPQDSAAEAATE